MGPINAHDKMETRTVLPGAHNIMDIMKTTMMQLQFQASYFQRLLKRECVCVCVDCAVSQALVLGLHKL
jgi:hypothetical protein